MRIKMLPPSYAKEAGDREIGVLIYTYDPAEQALCCAMNRWCDAVFDEPGQDDYYTHSSSVRRAGYTDFAHCDGFDFFCTRAIMRKFLNSWRSLFEESDLVTVDEYVGRGGAQ